MKTRKQRQEENTMKKMIRLANNIAVFYVVYPTENVGLFLDMVGKTASNRPDLNTHYEVFSIAKMPFEKLPEDIQTEVKNTLKVFNRCNVVYEYGEFHTSAGTCIKSVYNHDHFVCGEYLASEIYTPEERRQNYIEAFG